MVLETISLVVSVVAAILSGIEVFGMLWSKIKHIFGNKSRLRQSSRSSIEGALLPLLQRDLQLRIATEADARKRGYLRQTSQWDCWGDDSSDWS